MTENGASSAQTTEQDEPLPRFAATREYFKKTGSIGLVLATLYVTILLMVMQSVAAPLDGGIDLYLALSTFGLFAWFFGIFWGVVWSEMRNDARSRERGETDAW